MSRSEPVTHKKRGPEEKDSCPKCGSIRNRRIRATIYETPVRIVGVLRFCGDCGNKYWTWNQPRIKWIKLSLFLAATAFCLFSVLRLIIE